MDSDGRRCECGRWLGRDYQCYSDQQSGGHQTDVKRERTYMESSRIIAVLAFSTCLALNIIAPADFDLHLVSTASHSFQISSASSKAIFLSGPLGALAHRSRARMYVDGVLGTSCSGKIVLYRSDQTSNDAWIERTERYALTRRGVMSTFLKPKSGESGALMSAIMRAMRFSTSESTAARD